MPYESKKQQRWAHSPAGKEALTDKEIKEFDDSTDFDSIPEEAQAGKGPTRRQGSGKKEPDISRQIKKISREHNEGMKQGGFHSTPKGDKGYNRKEKHKTDHTVGEELTPVDETYRGINFPLAKSMNWAAGDDDDETPVVDTPGFPPTKEGGGNVPDKGAAWGSSIAADMSWSTWKPETFDDTGKDGDLPAWGMNSIVDRGVQPHEKPSGDKRIAEDLTQDRKVGGKQFKSFSMVGAFDW